MVIPGRKFTGGNGYRYGFNGKENDNEVKGVGNQQDYGMRIYDPRLARFLSLDPLQKSYPELTPYQFASNSPIQAIDLDGLEQYHFTFSQDAQGKTVLIPMNDGKPQDFEEDTFSPGWGGGVFGIFHTYKTTKNPRVEYVVHNQDSKQYFTEPGSLDRETFTYDETQTFSSYEEASGVTAYDFKETKEDIVVKLDATNKYNEAFLYAAAARYVSNRQKPATTSTANKQSAAANNGAKPITFTNATSSQVKSFISTEPGGQPLVKVSSIQKDLNSSNPFVWAQPVYTTVYKGQTYILEGHNRLKAVATNSNNTTVPIQQLSNEKAKEMFKSKMEDIEGGKFDKKISDHD